MIEILTASAGSGKTYQLAKKYISLLISDTGGDKYRHILAVTFTNKATAEMKGRILSELYVLASDPDKSKYLEDLVKELGIDRDEIRSRSELYLKNILHDYSSFAISTIDKFFQQALRSFTREIGCFAAYQVELDRDSLLKEAVDRILDSVSEENKELYEWIMSCMKDRIERGSGFKIDEKMLETAKSMGSGKYQNALEETGIDPASAFSKTNLRKIDDECNNIIRTFSSEVNKAAEELKNILTKTSELKQLEKYLYPFKSDERIEPLKATLRKAAPGSHFNFLMTEKYKIYNTAWQVRKLTYSLGFAREYEEQMAELMKEKNVMSLEDSNSILKRIIDGSDTPFIYEKMGVRYTDFLLDEFQDTSRVQWENLCPLLKESEARGGQNLIVGDVKQSIYRWRNSDWKLLDGEVPETFSKSCKCVSLNRNFRSCATVVDFNNKYFRFAADKMKEQFGNIEGTDAGRIYKDVCQEVRHTDPQQGMVRVDFCQPSADGSLTAGDVECGKILESVNNALENGASLNDIAVIVRTNREGGEVANYLKANGIDVISDDSLSIKSSRIVNLLVARFKQMLDENDPLAAYFLEDCDLAEPDSSNTLMDLAEHYLRELQRCFPEIFNAEILFVNGFMDILQEWSSTYSDSLPAFMEFWENNDAVASSPEGTDAVTVMTVHKAKGLEFGHVILPFADKISFDPAPGKSYWSWCRPDEDHFGQAGAMRTAVYPVSFTKSETPDSLFESAYDRESGLAGIDSINVFYVALTRAKNTLHIISALPSKSCIDAFVAKMQYEFKSPMEMMYWYLCGALTWSAGEEYDFRKCPGRETETLPDIFPGYPSVPLGNRLEPSTDAAEFFGEEGAVGAEASDRLAGIELHAILSKVYEMSDIDSFSGTREYDMLRKRVSDHPEWFSTEGRVYNEATIFTGKGNSLRPDKVIIESGSVTVIDYKFGSPKDSYISQVDGYVDLFKEMGYTDVQGYLWYVYEDSVIRVR